MNVLKEKNLSKSHNISPKILTFDSAASQFETLRAQGKTIVQCHGTFDLIHPGHIIHLEEAKALGDILVVTFTDDNHVNKGPGRPYFNDVLRCKSLAALESVDYVIAIPHHAAVEAIELVKPNIYCKGKEYERPENDVTGNIHDDVKTVSKYGGEIKYVGSIVFSSTKMINNHFGIASDDAKSFCQQLADRYTPTRFRDYIERFTQLKILLIGDIIFDRYTHVSIQGLTTKNRSLSSRFINEETQPGGALAVYRHLKQFCPRIDFLSLLGQEPWAQELIHTYISPEEDHIIRLHDFTSIVKQRFIETRRRSAEVGKVFSINYIDEHHPNGDTQYKVCKKIDDIIKNYDAVFVTDFGHGLMQTPVRELVQEKANYLALNCQTNSNNHGYNIISRQYYRANCFTVDEQELCLSCGQREPNHAQELHKLLDRLNSDNGWITRGAKDAVGIDVEQNTAFCPILEHQTIDTVGAGDAFFSVAALAARCEIPIDMATFMGQLAGAQAVKILGNSTSIEKVKLIKGGMSLLNY